MPKIVLVHAREVLDSRANPTIEVEVLTESGAFGRAIVPSGASTGENEALELRDKNSKRYLGKGVKTAVNNVNSIINKVVVGQSCLNQKELDEILIKLDGTNNKSKLGANAILGVSLAVAVCGANYKKMPLYKYLAKQKTLNLPVAMMNVINGGVHADSGIDFQEYMIVPHGAKTFAEQLRYGAETFYALKKLLKEKGFSTSVGDEGGFAPQFSSNEEPLQVLVQAITNAGFIAGKDISIALDVAASEFYNKENKTYELSKSGAGNLSSKDMCEWFVSLCKKYPIISIEDGIAENDYDGWKLLTKKLGAKIQLVGDDLFVTNLNYLKKGIKERMANAILIKPNQIGTLTETLQTISYAQKYGYKTVISHRSGESEDTFIADLAVAVNAMQIKTGSLCRGERTAKYNQLLRIEEQLTK